MVSRTVLAGVGATRVTDVYVVGIDRTKTCFIFRGAIVFAFFSGNISGSCRLKYRTADLRFIFMSSDFFFDLVIHLSNRC